MILPHPRALSRSIIADECEMRFRLGEPSQVGRINSQLLGLHTCNTEKYQVQLQSYHADLCAQPTPIQWPEAYRSTQLVIEADIAIRNPPGPRSLARWSCQTIRLLTRS